MRLTKLAIALAFGCTISAANLWAQELLQPTAMQSVAVEDYNYYTNQDEPAQPSPSDVVPDPVAPVGYACDGGKSGCGGGGNGSCGGGGGADFGFCDTPVPQPYLIQWKPLCFDIYGWVEGGGTANVHGNASNFNGPVTFNDREELQLNQAWLVMERQIDNGGCGWGIGGRVDIMWGTDARFTQALGLEVNQDGSNKWSNERFYQVAMPQMYVEFAYNDLSVKVGHFFTIIGYEVVGAPYNFFYSHAYTMQYGEPFTHTGVLASWKYNDQWTLLGGVTNGWDTFDNVNGRGSFLGGVNWTSVDERTTVAMAVTSGEEANGFGGLAPRTMGSLVLTRQLGDRWTYVFQSDVGKQDQGAEGGTADGEWYGVNQYLFYTINSCWKAGARFEWFRDDDGTRVATNVSGNPNGAAAPYEANYYEVTLGLNWTPTDRFFVRPEVRWDWADNGSRPYDDNNRGSQFTAACDVIWLF